MEQGSLQAWSLTEASDLGHAGIVTSCFKLCLHVSSRTGAASDASCMRWPKDSECKPEHFTPRTWQGSTAFVSALLALMGPIMHHQLRLAGLSLSARTRSSKEAICAKRLRASLKLSSTTWRRDYPETCQYHDATQSAPAGIRE